VNKLCANSRIISLQFVLFSFGPGHYPKALGIFHYSSIGDISGDYPTWLIHSFQDVTMEELVMEEREVYI
jgi:hypothetical protein